jgi:lysophospholipase
MPISLTIALMGALTIALRAALTIALTFASPSPALSEELPASLDFAAAKKILSDPRFAAPPKWKWNCFVNSDSAKIRYGSCETEVTPATGTVVIVPGFTEFAEVYFETSKDFLAHGYNVYVMDWRGSGGSDRYPGKTDRANSFGFDHDENDLDQFLSVIVKRHAKQPIFLVAQSIGSHIALRYLHDHQGIVTAAALAAPPLDLAGTQAPPWAVSFYSWLMCRNNRGSNFADKQGDWKYMAPHVSKMSSHSHDQVRVRLEEAWCAVNPSLSSGGATWNWLWHFQQSCDVLNSHGYAAEIKTPILLGCALSDRIANPKLEASYAKQIAGSETYSGEDARHDLFLEDNAHRALWMKAIFEFFKKHPTAQL